MPSLIERNEQLANVLYTYVVACTYTYMVINGLTVKEGKGNKAIEGQSVAESRRRLAGGSQGAIKVRNDWEVNGL